MEVALGVMYFISNYYVLFIINPVFDSHTINYYKIKNPREIWYNNGMNNNGSKGHHKDEMGLNKHE